MCFFLVLYWRSAILGGCSGANILRDNSRFDEFNSRLGGANSRFGPLREFVYNMLIYLTIFAARGPLHGENRQNSCFDGKNREFCRTGGTGRGAASRERHRAPGRKLTPEPRRLPGKRRAVLPAGGRRRGGRGRSRAF